MTNPLIQIGDETREMTDKEYDALVATGWTEIANEADAFVPNPNA